MDSCFHDCTLEIAVIFFYKAQQNVYCEFLMNKNVVIALLWSIMLNGSRLANA